MKSIYQRHIKCENSIFYKTITNANASVTATAQQQESWQIKCGFQLKPEWM